MIRKASLEDIKSILHVINVANREAFSKIIPKAYFREPFLSLEELLRDLKRMNFYVYEEEGKIVGVSALQVKREERTGIIYRVYVLPAYQRRGIGTSLIRKIEEEAKRIGLRKLMVLTDEKAYWALKFYKKLGYGIVNRIKRPHGFAVLMEKEISKSKVKG